MATNQIVNVQAVMFGFYDHRVEAFSPVGFVLKANDHIAAHFRMDIKNFDFPPLFEFTVTHLPAVIFKSIEDHEAQGVKIENLYDFLNASCFDGVGSLRCWDTGVGPVSWHDVDALVDALRDIVNGKLLEHSEKLNDYKQACEPDWSRLPNVEPVVKVHFANA